jgi:DNA-directed RNA polymerase specialized sigma24 family protein
VKVGRRRRFGSTEELRWSVMYREGLSTRAIAAREGVSNGAVRDALSRARVEMRAVGRPARGASR